jgi:hypothetical protein
MPFVISLTIRRVLVSAINEQHQGQRVIPRDNRHIPKICLRQRTTPLLLYHMKYKFDVSSIQILSYHLLLSVNEQSPLSGTIGQC